MEGADELRHGMLFHDSDISKRTSDFSEPNKIPARRRADFRFAYAGGAEEEKQPTGRAGFLRSGAAAANGASERGDGFCPGLMTRLCSSGSMAGVSAARLL